jgi:aspartate ammonia-lyase
MPGKANPVIPEAATQVAMLVIGHDASLSLACASGSLELNPFLPLVAMCLLESIELLARADDILARHCVAGLEADEQRCRQHVEGSTAMVTALVPALGYEQASAVAVESRRRGCTIRQVVREMNLLSDAEIDALVAPEAVCRLGSPAPLAPVKHEVYCA